MRTPTDALRSLKRYTALALGSDWEIRASGEKGVFHRPYARVAQVPSVSLTHESWHVSKIICSYVISAFPARMNSADESQFEALRVADLLWVAFGGPGVPGQSRIRTPGDSHRAIPARIPLYDYVGIPLRGPRAFADETRRGASDFMRLEGPPDLTVAMNDDDELLWSLAANIRMSWLRSAAVPSTRNVTSSVQLEAG